MIVCRTERSVDVRGLAERSYLVRRPLIGPGRSKARQGTLPKVTTNYFTY